jgi:hypothetical protein
MHAFSKLGLAMIAIAMLALGCDSSTAPGSEPDIDAAPGIDARLGGSCGGLAGGMCAATEFCNYAGHSCGTSDALGTCEARPEICAADLRPVCGCDGMVYTDECHARIAGHDTSAMTACTPPAGYPKRCGDIFCTASETCTTNGTEPSATYSCH